MLRRTICNGVIFALVLFSCRGPASPIDGDWLLVSETNLYANDVRVPDKEILLGLAHGRFRWSLGGQEVTNGSYTVSEQLISSAHGDPESGPTIELSAEPLGMLGTKFVFRLGADTLTFFTTLDDGTDYAFIRRE